MINIYGLVYPSTQDVIYVGQTRTSIEHRLDSHYWKLNEAKRGKRTMTKLFKFLDSYLPLRVQVKLLRVVDTDKPFNDADFMEKYYINYYRKINPNLLNETNGVLVDIQQLINLIMKNLLLDVKFPTLLKDVKNLKVLLNI